jgi:rhamnosyltransferase subunit B
LFGVHDPPVLPSGKKMGGPMWFRRAVFGLMDKTVFKPVGRDLNMIRHDLELPLWRNNYMRAYLAADLNLCLFPDWFAPATPDWPETARHVGFVMDPPEGPSELADELSAFIDAGPPPLVVTPGPAGYQYSDEFFRAATAACTTNGLRAVFVTRGQKLELKVPDTIIAVDFAPFAALFPKAAMLVHHGGIGTVAHGLAAGCRQLITPFGFDQPDNAYRLKQLGVGDMLMARTLNGPKLAAKIAQMLASSEMGTKAEAIKQKMAANTDEPVDTACELIEGLVA